MDPFGAPIGHISMLGAERVVGLWADALELAKASRHGDLGADGSRSWQHVLSLVSSAAPPCLLWLGAERKLVGSASSKRRTQRGAGLRAHFNVNDFACSKLDISVMLSAAPAIRHMTV